jgi:uncharacterized membrane protein
MIVRIVVSSLVAAVLSSLALTGVATAGDVTSSTPAVTVLGQDPLSVKPDQGSDSATTSLTLLSQNAQPISAVTLVSDKAQSVKVKGYDPKSAIAGATSVDVKLSGLKGLERKVINGQLVVTAGGVHSARALKITPAVDPVAFGSWPRTILIGTIVASLLLAFAACAGGGAQLKAKAPGPKWSFDSWGTTLTTVGAALGTVLGAATFPDVPDQITKDALIQLNLLFGVLVIVAPFAFQALRAPAKNFDPEAFYGTNGTLLLSCAVTGAAVLGEIVTLGVLGWELAGPGSWGWLAAAGALAVFGLACWYFGVTTHALVRTPWEAKKAAEDQESAQPQQVVVVVRHPDELAADVLAADAGATTEQRVPVTLSISRPRASWPLP